jgi:hypothetical protein
MVPINVQKEDRNFGAYNDIYGMLQEQKLNNETNGWLKYWMTDVPQNAVGLAKDLYSAYEYEQDKERQDELDELDRKLKERELDTAEQKYQLMQDMEPYRKQVYDSMKKRFDEASDEDKIKFLPYMSLGGIYGY